MAKHSHNLAAVERLEMNLEGEENTQGFKNELLAKKALNSLLSAKEWAAKLKVSHQKINEWKNNGAPKKRHMQIVQEAKQIFIDDLHNFETEIDRALLMSFGPAGRNMIDRGGTY